MWSWAQAALSAVFPIFICNLKNWKASAAKATMNTTGLPWYPQGSQEDLKSETQSKTNPRRCSATPCLSWQCHFNMFNVPPNPNTCVSLWFQELAPYKEVHVLFTRSFVKCKGSFHSFSPHFLGDLAESQKVAFISVTCRHTVLWM